MALTSAERSRQYRARYPERVKASQDSYRAAHPDRIRETQQRFAICKNCDRLFKPTRTCKEYGCFMALKTWLKDASCVLHDNPKW